MRAAEVIVYVEGPSDRAGMEALLAPLIQRKQEAGIRIRFVPTSPGRNKESVLKNAPKKAVGTLLGMTHAIVVAMPDLYPKSSKEGFEHETSDQLRTVMIRKFDEALQSTEHADDDLLKERFKVFCFKYDLEALILASEEALQAQLGVDHLRITWQIPVEDQNHDQPPKRIVEALFRECGRRYQDTEDAPLILGASDYRDIADKCPQCFKPFVEFLTELQPIGYHNQHG